MFRRRWSGLPADPIFPSSLKELGYFINDIDEIRSIEDSDYYFKYFITKNDRWNERQRFAFNEAVVKEIHARLAAAGFTTVPLPLKTPPTQPHVPILTSPNLPTATRVVLLFSEPCQSLGVLAHRVIGGRGGITRGSVLGFVNALKTQQSSATDPSPPGVVLANAGELWWWPEGRRGLTPIERHMVPMASAVHLGRYHDPQVNEVPGNRTVAEHVKGVFESVVMGGLVAKDAKVDIIVLGDTAEEVERYLDDDKVWEKVEEKLNCVVVMGGFYSSKNFKCEGFKRFMKERARAYIIHHDPLNTPIAGPGGNPGVAGFTSYGCPVFSAGEAIVTETMFIEAQPEVLDWVQDVALKGAAYKNEVFEIFGEEANSIASQEHYTNWSVPETVPEEVESKGKKDTKASVDKDGSGEEQQVKHNGGKTDSKSAGQATPREINGKADVLKVQANVSKPQLTLISDGPEARDMKDLAEELADLKLEK